MTPFGAVALLLALIHDLFAPDNPHQPKVGPWGAVAFGFSAGLDVVAGGVAEAWDQVTGKD